jgi:TolA-binding protein
VYTDPRVAEFITANFLPVRVHVQRNRDEYKELAARYNAQWTPTVLVLDRKGEERHRIEGFLPAEDFLAQLEFGVAQVAMADQQFGDAEQRFRQVIDQHAGSDLAPAALYWAGVARYKATGDPSALKDTADQFKERYTDSAWAKRASVWAA